MPKVRLINHSVTKIQGKPLIQDVEVSETKAELLLLQYNVNWLTHEAHIIKNENEDKTNT